jgi:tetratricopeptide (TPR) repeat protein
MGNGNTIKDAKSSSATFESLYLKSEYKKAVELLIQNKEQFSSGNFHYNLGLAHAKLSDFGLARFHFEKAINNGMKHSAAFNNLEYVKSKLQVNDISNSDRFSDRFVNTSLDFPIDAFILLTFIFLLIALLTIKIKKVTNYLKIASLVLVSLLPLFCYFIFLGNLNSAIALRDIPVYEGPSKVFQEKGSLKAGAKIIIGEFKEGWFFIQQPQELAGWVKKDDLGIF